jgi:NAD(P)H-flavin reductase
MRVCDGDNLHIWYYNPSMELAKPQQYHARVSDKYFVSENERFLYVKFELVLPDRIEYQAGQYVSFQINKTGERRCYSIASTPDDNHGFHILAEIVEGGRGSEFLKKIEIGGEVEVLAPLGRFVVNIPMNQYTNESMGNKLLFVATGSGIVPIYAMINDLLINKQEKRQMRLHWGMRSEEDLFFVDNLERLVEENPNFVFDIVLSKPGTEWDLCTGHVQDCLGRDFDPSTSSGLAGWGGYLCGMPDKVISIATKLEELGMKTENIHYEKFA